MSFRVLDLFSGIGGFALGLGATGGFEPAAFCDNNPKCRHLLEHYWPEVPTYDDVCTITGERLVADGVAVDAITAGFPCQDLSYAGLGAGLAGARSGLWFEIPRLVRELHDLGRPVRLLILENVSALLGRGLGTVLGDLAALGFDAEWDCIPAAAVGAPHLRDRIWIVAYSRGEQHEGFGDAFRRALAAELPSAALANTDLGLHEGELDGGASDGAPGRSEGGDAGEGQAPHRERIRPKPGAGGAVLADAQRGRSQGRSRRGVHGAGRAALKLANSREAISDAHGERLEGCWLSASAERFSSLDLIRGGEGGGRSSPRQGGWWATEPDVGRVAHGIPARVDRLHGLGNAVVPEIPYRIGRAILAANSPQRAAA